MTSEHRSEDESELEQRRGGTTSVRVMLLWPLLLTLLVGFVTLGWFVVRSVQADAVAQVDAELLRVSNREFPPGGRPPPPPEPGDLADPAEVPDADAAAGAIDRPVAMVVRADGDVALIRGRRADSPADARVAALRDERGFIDVAGADGESWRAHVSARGDSTNIVLIDLEDVQDTVSRLRRSLIIGGMGVFAIQALAVWMVTRRIAQPITAVANAASRIAEGELDTAIPASDRPHETAELAASVGVMVQRLRSTIDEAELSAAEAAAARDQMQRFLADASHELRTPLTSIGGYAQLHNRGMLSGPDLDRAMGRVESESARLARLVDDMLILARGADRSFRPERLDVVGVLDAVVTDLRAAHPGRQIERSDAAAPASFVSADRDQLHQAILNLGKNALEHSPAEVPVTVAVRHTGDSVAIDVIDRGEGIAEEDATRVFDAFYRADASRYRADEQSGAGLGLAITKMIADRHGASLHHTPTPGGGTTFTLTLTPVIRTALGPQTTKARHSGGPRKSPTSRRSRSGA